MEKFKSEYLIPAEVKDRFPSPLVVAIGEQYPNPEDPLKPFKQKFFTRADHKVCNTTGELLGALRLKAKTLPDEPTDEDRLALKNASPFILAGGLLSGGSEKPLTAAEKKDEAYSKQFTRCNATAAPSLLYIADVDKISPEAARMLIGDEEEEGLLDELGVMAVAYHTPRSTEDTPRVRFAIVLAEPVSPDDKSETALKVEQWLMLQMGAVRNPDKAGAWIWTDEDGQNHPIEFDSTQYRRAQMLYAPPKNGRFWAIDGDWLKVDALPELDEAGLRAASANAERVHKFPIPTTINALTQWALDNDGVLIKPNFIAMPHNMNQWQSEIDSYNDAPDSSFGLLIADDIRESRFKNQHASWSDFVTECNADGASHQYRAAVAIGVPVELAAQAFGGEYFDSPEFIANEFDVLPPLVKFEGEPNDTGAPAAPVTEINGRAAFLSATGGQQIIPFKKWDGLTGNKYEDEKRQELADLLDKPLRYMPPQVSPKINSKGEICGVKYHNHIDNVKWSLYRKGFTLARNLMTWEVECFDTRTGKRISASETKTWSLLVGLLEKYGLKKEMLVDHLEAVAEDTQFHPVANMLHGLKWDGVGRVERVIKCLPVAADKEKLTRELILSLLVAAIVAVDNGKVSYKFAPVLYSEANDYFKTSFYRRLFDILPGAFKEGVSLDPTDKTSLRGGLFCWFAELGELDSMTKRESGPIKAFIGKDCDEWRQEHSKTMTRKQRQTVFGGTVNMADFLKEASSASRFPVIELTAPIRIDEVNEILGWELVNNEPMRTRPQELIQFWLEVRELVKAGASHMLDVDTLTEMKANNAQYIDKGIYHDAIYETLVTNPQAFQSFDEWFTSRDAQEAVKAPSSAARQIGKTLSTMVKDGVLKKRKYKGIFQYALAVPITAANDEEYAPDLSVAGFI
ncbi:TPA: hypothetical protein QH074_004287 [Enterobacter hormaechei subsp. steigerwaltii]|nr:hypothetical protein [Enterobacter hormaechei subsp. steigerwaltii]